MRLEDIEVRIYDEEVGERESMRVTLTLQTNASDYEGMMSDLLGLTGEEVVIKRKAYVAKNEIEIPNEPKKIRRIPCIDQTTYLEV